LRNWGLAGALIIFVAGLVWTIRETPGLEPTISVWQLLLLLMLSAPAGTVLNTLELYALGRIAGGPMPMRTSLELTIYTSAANMLPLPGGVVTKLAGMKAHGSSYKAALVTSSRSAPGAGCRLVTAWMRFSAALAIIPCSIRQPA
jgi:hypothetical protein